MIMNIIRGMAKWYPYVASSCLVWYVLDPNIETLPSQIHLSIAGIFGIAWSSIHIFNIGKTNKNSSHDS